jgi:DNA-binding HxlR family transcriptional regulator
LGGAAGGGIACAAMGRRRPQAPSSPLADALARVGDRWTLLVVAALLEREKRFNELQDELEGIAPNVLSGRLKLLTEQGLIATRPYSERPPRFVYELTASGRELGGALRLLADWGARSAGQGEPLRHGVCGTPLEARWWCPSCESAVDEPGDDELVHV